MQARQAPQLNKSGCALHTYFVFKKINLVKSKTFNISISIDYIKTKKWLRRLCTVHFGFMSPFFFFVRLWRVELCYLLCLSYHCFIVLLLFGLISALFGLIWA